MSTAMVLELSEGCELVIDGESWRVERLEPYWGKVMLRSADGTGGRERQTTIAALRGIHLTGLSQVSGSPGPGCLWALDAWRAASLARRCGWLRLGLGVGD